MKLIKHITVILLVLSSTLASAQITFESKVSKKRLGINELYSAGKGTGAQFVVSIPK